MLHMTQDLRLLKSDCTGRRIGPPFPHSMYSYQAVKRRLKPVLFNRFYKFWGLRLWNNPYTLVTLLVVVVVVLFVVVVFKLTSQSQKRRLVKDVKRNRIPKSFIEKQTSVKLNEINNLQESGMKKKKDLQA